MKKYLLCTKLALITCLLGLSSLAAAKPHTKAQLARMQNTAASSPQTPTGNRWLVQTHPAPVVAQNRPTKEPYHLWGYGLGPASVSNLGTNALVYTFSATKFHEVSPHAEVRYRVSAGLANDSSAYMLSAMLGGAYFFLPTNVTPLVGAEFGLAYADSDLYRDAGGFAGGLIAGLRLFKSASTQLELVTRYETIFSRNNAGMPAQYGLQIAVLL